MPSPYEEFQTAVAEIREVCRKHGVVLYGQTREDGSIGEIQLHVVEWRHCIRDFDAKVTNRVETSEHGFVVKGIGG